MYVLNITKITLAWELFEAGAPKTHIASRIRVQRETVHLWIKGILEHGLMGFLDIYSKAKKGPRIKRQVDPILKRWVWEIREREMDCCGQKIIYFLDTCMQRRFNSRSDLIQADGGHEFKDKFKAKVYNYTDRFRVARPYKKNEQSYIESFNRTVRKECLGWSKYKPDQIPKLTIVVNQFLDRYHYHRPHIGLGTKVPLER